MSHLSTAGHLPVSVVVCVWEEWPMAVRKLPTRIFVQDTRQDGQGIIYHNRPASNFTLAKLQ